MKSRHLSFAALVVAGVAVTALVLGACSSEDSNSSGDKPADSSQAKLVVYSGQHEDLTKKLTDAFSEKTGIPVEVRAGDDADLVNQIIEEGNRSKADVILTEEPGPIAQLDSRSLLVSVDPATLGKVDQRFVPSTGDWLPWAARSRVLFYNPDLISESELPKSIMDLVKPEWKGRFAYAPSGAFVSTVNYLINEIGEDATLEWLRGIKDNGINEQKNGKVRDSVEAGQHEFGLANHYYWYILAKEKGGPDALASRVHFMTGKDAGGLVLASGAGILKSASNVDSAQEFLAWLADREGGQRIVAADTPQYPVVDGLDSSFGIKPLSELDPPVFDQGSLNNSAAAKDLLIKAGIV